MTTPHIEQRIQYNEDEAAWLKAGAPEGQEPWRGWEILSKIRGWQGLDYHPAWYESSQYRRKPRTIKIGEFEYPEPVRAELKDGDLYFLPATDFFDLYSSCKWVGNESDDCFLKRGLIHLTKEATIAHATALIKAGGGVV